MNEATGDLIEALGDPVRVYTQDGDVLVVNAIKDHDVQVISESSVVVHDTAFTFLSPHVELNRGDTLITNRGVRYELDITLVDDKGRIQMSANPKADGIK